MKMRTTMSCHEMHFFSLQILWNFSIVGFCTWNALTLWNLVGLFWGKISLKTFRIQPRKVIKNICTFYHVRFQFFVKCTWRSLQLIVVLSKKNCCFLFSLFIEVNAVRKKRPRHRTTTETTKITMTNFDRRVQMLFERELKTRRL